LPFSFLWYMYWA